MAMTNATGLRVGVVGCGYWGSKHIRVLHSLESVDTIAVIDPNGTQVDPISGRPIMREVLTILGPTPEAGGGVKEWCINTAAVDPATHSVLINSEDGFLYRWDLSAPAQFTQRIRMNNGVAQSYTPTAIGADGAVYAVNNAALFSVGR